MSHTPHRPTREQIEEKIRLLELDTTTEEGAADLLRGLGYQVTPAAVPYGTNNPYIITWPAPDGSREAFTAQRLLNHAATLQAHSVRLGYDDVVVLLALLEEREDAALEREHNRD